MRINYDKETKEIAIDATVLELARIAESLAKNGSYLKCSDKELIAKWPYSSFLECIQVVHSGDDKVRVCVAEDKILKIIGGEGNLKLFAKNIEIFAKHTKWHHIHEEYYPEHPYIAEDSAALIVTVVT